MKDIIFKGCATAIVTPFDENNQIQFDEFKKLVDYQIDNGVNAIVVCGTTGEAVTLSQEEKQELIQYCVKVVHKRVPVIAGIGSNNTNAVLENGILESLYPDTIYSKDSGGTPENIPDLSYGL